MGVLDRAALVVDTGLGPRNGARVLAQAGCLAGDRPLYLTTTHFHPEHGFGAQAFAGAATFIANRAQLDELRAKGPGYLAMFSGFGPQVAAELDELIALDLDVVVPGHGELTDLGTVRAVRDYLRHVVAEVARLHAAGATVEDATAIVDQAAHERWPDWQNPE